MKTYSIQDLIDYRSDIEQKIKNRSDALILNDSIVHAAIVQKAILDAASENSMPVNMYCGQFSIYQDETKNKIETIMSQMDGYSGSEFHPYEDLIGSLKSYLDSKEGCMTVILDKPESLSALSKQKVWQKIGGSVTKGNLKFYALSSPFGLDHFTVAGTMYRRENSDQKKTAFCCFNSEKAYILENVFGFMLKGSTEIPV